MMTPKLGQNWRCKEFACNCRERDRRWFSLATLQAFLVELKKTNDEKIPLFSGEHASYTKCHAVEEERKSELVVTRFDGGVYTHEIYPNGLGIWYPNRPDLLMTFRSGTLVIGRFARSAR